MFKNEYLELFFTTIRQFSGQYIDFSTGNLKSELEDPYIYGL